MGDWWRDAVFYQIYPRSFYDSNNDGIGDLEGIRLKLDYLLDLGIDAIWISPFYRSPMADFGYDISDYRDVDPIFGTLSDFDHLLEDAHKKGIKVIIDQVYNHTSDQHPWFIESRSSKDNSKADWYIWQDPKPDGSPPNNWLSFFAGIKDESAWQWDEGREQYYLRLFAKEQPDLNWRNPEVKQAVLDSIKFWLDRGVDGFRFDVVSLYYKDPELRNTTLNPYRKDDPNKFRRYNMFPFAGRPETLLAVEEIRRLMDSYKDIVGVGEVATDRGLVGYLDFVLPGRLHLAFNFEFLHINSLDPGAINRLIIETDKVYNTIAWPSYVLGNHDVTRIISRFANQVRDKKALARALAILLLTLRGTPFIYYGEEIGMENTPVPYEKIMDPLGKNLWPEAEGRDVVRTPMQWDNTVHAGFSDVEPWLPINENKIEINVERELSDPASILSFYKALIRKRKESNALKRGEYRPIIEDTEDILLYRRFTDEEEKYILVNLKETNVRCNLREIGLDRVYKVYLGTHRKEGELLKEEIGVSPFEGIIFEEG